MKYPFKAKLIDLRYPNTIYVLKVKDDRDWANLKDLEASPNYKVRILDKTDKQILDIAVEID
jgi:hypothetical protein